MSFISFTITIFATIIKELKMQPFMLRTPRVLIYPPYKNFDKLFYNQYVTTVSWFIYTIYHHLNKKIGLHIMYQLIHATTCSCIASNTSMLLVYTCIISRTTATMPTGVHQDMELVHSIWTKVQFLDIH